MDKLIIRGTEQERQLFVETNQHYTMADEDNRNRWKDWDSKYEAFRSWIDESNWPYSSLIFVPHTFTSIFEKMARLNGGKPRGRLIPREGGDIVKAKVNNELLSFQWDEAGRTDADPMIAKWAQMDMQTRIYGGSFAISKWKYECDADGETRFDGPTFKVLNPKDSLPNPSYSVVKNWFQYREYVTLKELKTINDVSGKKPKYKNLDLLRQSIKDNTQGSGDMRDVRYTPRGKEIMNLTDYLGADESEDFKIVELVTELQDDRKIVIAPRHGVVLQDIPNPYKHKQIPVVHLRYIKVDDDIWGLSEIEPVEKVQRAMNALTSQFVDSINMDLYRILKIRASAVQMHTLEFGPGKKWLMNNPDDVIPLEHSGTATNQFVNVYSLLVGMYKEAMGDTSAAFSSLEPFGKDKTATEIRESQLTKSVRDNFNQIFLSAAIEQMMMFWLLMNQQFIFNDPTKMYIPLRVVGRDAIQEFLNMGLNDYKLDGSEEQILAQAALVQDGIEPKIPEIPKYPVNVDGETKPKFDLDRSNEYGTIIMTPEDMTGNYDFIADVEPMRVASTYEEQRQFTQALELILNPASMQMLQMEGKKVKFSELLIDALDKIGVKGSEKYFEVMEEQNVGLPVNAGGEQGGQPGATAPGLNSAAGLGNNQEMAGGPGVPQLGGSPPVQAPRGLGLGRA